MSKRIRIFTTEDVEQHKGRASCWVTRDGKVYDVTEFLPDHPGGDDLILNYGGKDVDAVMRDAQEHDHSESAFDMLDGYAIGRLGASEAIVDEGQSADGMRTGVG
jgi:4-hydroxysphinganine ceramide fatty acyl 2-hydroxylase